MEPEMKEDVDLRALVEAGEEAEDVTPEVNGVEITWTPEEQEEAEAMGYIPPERAGKLPEGKKFLTPKEYMERNPLYGKMKKLESSMDHLNDHYQKVAKMEREKAEKEFEQRLATLRAEKIEALDNADHARVVEIDDEIMATEKPSEQKQDDISPEFKEWVEDNKWFEENEFLQVEANLVGEQLAGTGLRGKSLLNKVKEHLKKKYPSEFSNPNREKPSPVEGGSRKPAKSKDVSLSDLTADEMKIFNNFNMRDVLKTDENIKKYVKETIALRD